MPFSANHGKTNGTGTFLSPFGVRVSIVKSHIVPAISCGMTYIFTSLRLKLMDVISHASTNFIK